MEHYFSKLVDKLEKRFGQRVRKAAYLAYELKI